MSVYDQFETKVPERTSLNTLIYTEKIVREVDYKEIDRFIRVEFGHDFECVADQEWNNGEYHSIEIQKDILSLRDLEDVENFIKSGTYPGQYKSILYSLLTYLCNQEKIEEGNYLISVYW